MNIKTEAGELVETSKKVLDEENLKTLTTMAVAYWNQGWWKEAEELRVRILEVTKRVFGEEHQNTLTSMANLAMTFWSQGRWKEAEELGVQVLEACKRVLGEEHPNTLTTMANLAVTFRSQGRWKEAEELGLQVLEAKKRVFGEEHSNTLTSMANLAMTFSSQGRWEEAEELGVKVLEISKRVLGEEHPNTLTIMANLAMTFRGQGRWEEAEKLGSETLKMRKRVLGEKHPDTLASISDLDLALASSNKNRQDRSEDDTLQPSCLEDFYDPVESVALNFCYSHELAPSITAAYERLPKGATGGRLESLLHIYSSALLITASTLAEKDVSLLIRSKAREISLRIEHYLKVPIQIGAYREEFGKLPLGLRETGVINSKNCFSKNLEGGVGGSGLLVQGTQSFLICGPAFRRLVELAKALPLPKAQWKIEVNI